MIVVQLHRILMLFDESECLFEPTTMILCGGHCALTIIKGVLGECTYLSNRLKVVLAFTEGLVWHVFYGLDSLGILLSFAKPHNPTYCDIKGRWHLVARSLTCFTPDISSFPFC